MLNKAFVALALFIMTMQFVKAAETEASELPKNSDCISEIKKSPGSTSYVTKNGVKLAYFYDNPGLPNKIQVGREFYTVLYAEDAKTVVGLKSDKTGHGFNISKRRTALSSEEREALNKKWRQNRLKKCDTNVEKFQSTDSSIALNKSSGGEVHTDSEDDGPLVPEYPEDLPYEYTQLEYWEPEVHDWFGSTWDYLDREKQKICIQRLEDCNSVCNDSGDKAEMSCAAFAAVFWEIPWFSGPVALMCVMASKGARKECNDTCGSMSQCM